MTGRVGAVIPYRMRASRLPGKPLLDVAGKTVLERVAAQAARCRYVALTVIATTRAASDDQLARFAERKGLMVHRGPERDVLRRLTEAAQRAQLDVVVVVDGDDLLCAHEYMDRGVEILASEEADLVRFEGLPVGGTPSVLSTSALAQAVELKDTEDTETGFFRFIETSDAFRILRPPGDPAHAHASCRLTLDYEEDLEFFRALFPHLDERPDWSFADLIALLRRLPDLVEINRKCQAKYEAHFRAGIRDREQGC